MSKSRRVTFGCVGVSIWLLAFLSAKMVSAQVQSMSAPYTWKNVIVGGGGFIPGIVFSPIEKDLVYLRSDMGGCYRWDKSLATWVPLNDGMSESSYHGGESIAPDPIDPEIVYIAAGMYRSDPAAMLRSKDRGKSWEIYPVSFKMGGNEDGRGLGERLAINPKKTSTLYFGSRHDGLMRSDDSARTWKQVESFPLKGGGKAGLSFVAFADSGLQAAGEGSQTIFVGSADPGAQHLFRSDDDGATWNVVAGGPGSEMLPIQGKCDSTGMLYLTCSNGVGPNGVTDGCVYSLNFKNGKWEDISPVKGQRSPGGYGGLSLDRQHPEILAVSTFNHWSPTDTIWRTIDGGKTWLDISAKSQRDVTSTPFLNFGASAPRLGWWIAGLAIDPFNSDHVVYATGATVFVSKDFSNVSKGEATHWEPWVTGIDQTAIITLVSPTDGPHLLSGFGDIGGFVHDDLDHSPPQGIYVHPVFTNTDSIDYAGDQPNVVVRSGRGSDARFGYSEDFGHTWTPISPPSATPSTAAAGRGARRRSGNGRAGSITVSADGKKIIISGTPCVASSDRGKTWKELTSLPADAHLVVDRVKPDQFYAMSPASGKLFVSTDGGDTFNPRPYTGVPSPFFQNGRGNGLSLKPTTGKGGDLWLVGGGGLFHSTDAGQTFARSPGSLHVEMLGFGKPAPGHDYPALFAIGSIDNLRAIWRSDDIGETWLRVNDDAHQYGTRFRCIEGDPRVFGRVYVGTDGRGILYGDPMEKK